MSLIQTGYVPEWRISAHAQSVLAAGQSLLGSVSSARVFFLGYHLIDRL